MDGLNTEGLEQLIFLQAMEKYTEKEESLGSELLRHCADGRQVGLRVGHSQGRTLGQGRQAARQVALGARAGEHAA